MEGLTTNVEILHNYLKALRSNSPGLDCAVRNCLAFMGLRKMGYPAMLHIGSMLYRVGPDECDSVTFCGKHNKAYVCNDRSFIGHWWVEINEYIVDMTSNTWKSLNDGDDISNLICGRIKWAIEPPVFVCEVKSQLCESWTERGTPSLGKAYYQEFEYLQSYKEEMLHYLEPEILRHYAAMCHSLGISNATL